MRVDDLIVHPREHDLIAGTHGRSIWILDDISALEQMTETTTQRDAYSLRCASGDVVDQRHPEADPVGGAKNFRGQNPARGTAISYWLKTAPAGDVRYHLGHQRA